MLEWLGEISNNFQNGGKDLEEREAEFYRLHSERYPENSVRMNIVSNFSGPGPARIKTFKIENDFYVTIYRKVGYSLCFTDFREDKVVRISIYDTHQGDIHRITNAVCFTDGRAVAIYSSEKNYTSEKYLSETNTIFSVERETSSSDWTEYCGYFYLVFGEDASLEEFLQKKISWNPPQNEFTKFLFE